MIKMAMMPVEVKGSNQIVLVQFVVILVFITIQLRRYLKK